MTVADFGRMDGEIVLFGGVYSNLQAFDALIKAVGDRPAISTGDLVAYGARPAEVVAHFRSLAWRTISGNCEERIGAGSDDCGCGFEAGTICDALSRNWYPFASDAIDDEARSWMRDLPRIATFVQGSRRYAVVHGGATDVARYLWPVSSDAEFLAEIAAVERLAGPVDGVIAGHSGIAFHRVVGRHQWVNAGAVGLPPHDGRPETRYAVLCDGDIVFERLAYDAVAAQGDMRENGLVQGYDTALTTGIWPSEDVLPGALRR